MQIRIFHALTLFNILLFLSCGKGVFGPARVDGIVNDATTGDPVYNAKVYLLERENSFDFFGPIPASYIIDSTTTGAQGRFEFNYEDRHGYIYAVYAVKHNYIDNYNSGDILSLGSGTDVEILLQPEAFLSVHYKNIVPALASDIFGINGDITETLYGSEIDTTLIYRVDGNTKIELHWAVGYDMTVSDTIYCSAFEMTYFEILY